VFVQLEQQKRQLAAQLVTTRQMLEANEMLMAVLSHDLRTPLGAVLASAEYLMRTAADEQSATVAARVKNSSLRMARMVDQLPHLARLQGGRLPLQPRSIELATLCRSVIDEFASRENGKRIVFASRGNTAGAWDTDLVWQAVSNLVSNALHHGVPGGDIGVEVDGEAVDSVRLKVANRGTIPPEVFPHLFKAFGPNNSGARSREGLGLGLHIVQEIARMHGGNVSVHSDEATGTVFTIELPRMVTFQRGSFTRK
jgi:signal transduction histidine kinase